MNELDPLRILCVDDHPVFCAGIDMVLSQQRDMTLAATAATGEDAILQFRQHRPDVTLMDLRLPDMNGVDAMCAILGEFPEARVIVLTTAEGDFEIRRALGAGACGYILKSSPHDELVAVIRQVGAGRKHLPIEIAMTLAESFDTCALSERELQVLERVAEGDRNRDIAEVLSITEETVKAHLKRILDKLGAKDRTQAVAIAVRRGIIHF